MQVVLEQKLERLMHRCAWHSEVGVSCLAELKRRTTSKWVKHLNSYKIATRTRVSIVYIFDCT